MKRGCLKRQSLFRPSGLMSCLRLQPDDVLSESASAEIQIDAPDP